MIHAPVASAAGAAAGLLAPHGPAVATAASFTPADVGVHFFLQLALILATCVVIGRLGERWLGQPRVVGEMIAGVVLGPSLFGMIAPAAAAMAPLIEERATST